MARNSLSSSVPAAHPPYITRCASAHHRAPSSLLSSSFVPPPAPPTAKSASHLSSRRRSIPVPPPLPPPPRLGSRTPPPSSIRRVNGHGHLTMTQPAPDQLMRRRCWVLERRLTAVTGGGLRQRLTFSMDDCSLLKCPRGWMSPAARWAAELGGAGFCCLKFWK